MIKKISHSLGRFFALALCMSLLSCGGLTQEEQNEPKRGYPSIGVGRSDMDTLPVDDGSITICIDPGHGFDDVGCSSAYLLGELEEKDMTLLYARDLQTRLEELGYRVILTHDGESFPQAYNFNGNNIFSVDERAAYVNDLDVDYFLSLHCDTFEDSGIGGTRVYYYDTDVKDEPYSPAIAKSISDYLLKQFPNDKTPTLHDNEPYLVLRETTMSANLLEICFISNKTDAMHIQDPVWQEGFITGVVEGIHNYFTLYSN